MTAYAGRHRTPKSTPSLSRMGATAATSLAAVAVAVPAAGAASAAPSVAATPSATSGTSTSTATIRTLWLGHRGGLVKQVQRKVGVGVDGVYGPRTKAAVKRWQKRHGLVADGVVGPRTAAKMGLRATTTKKKASRSSARTSTTTGIVSTAARYYGTRYRYGGTSPTSGFDCSGFTGYVYKKHGKALPRTAEQQRRAASKTSNPQPGDLVFFGAPAYHVGIYAGAGKIIDSGRSGTSVSKRAIWTNQVSYGRF
ncbi:NlpC/P60 family protein [Janibacter melonis]|nr:NlpC/P60 family protein [Janibacter melonis]